MSRYLAVRALLVNGRLYPAGVEVPTASLRPGVVSALVKSRRLAAVNAAGEPIAEAPRPAPVALPSKAEIRAQYKARA